MSDKALREHVIYLLQGGGAHLDFEKAIADLPPDHRGAKVDGYWPDDDAPPDESSWDKSVQSFRDNLQSMIELVSDPNTDLYAKIPHGDGQTILREALPDSFSKN